MRDEWATNLTNFLNHSVTEEVARRKEEHALEKAQKEAAKGAVIPVTHEKVALGKRKR
jgi:hypothetical protein